VWLGRAEGASVFVGDVELAGVVGVGEDLGQGGGVFGGFVVGVELAVAVVDGDFVPIADVVGVGVGEVGMTGGVEGDVGVWVVHDGVGLRDAGGGEVVGEAEGVAGFVGG
jgi:hypothetical protein